MLAPAAPKADWAVNMLLRMYTRWAEQHGYKVEYLEETEGEEATSSRRPSRTGRNAYGWLKTEEWRTGWCASRRSIECAAAHLVCEREGLSGHRRPHRGRHQGIGRTHRHAALERGGGPARQQDRMAIRLTHIPTNIVVYCQNDRSQHRNRAQAWQMLARAWRARIEEARGSRRNRERRQDRYRLRPPDSPYRAAALPGRGRPGSVRPGVATSNTGGVLMAISIRSWKPHWRRRRSAGAPAEVADVE